MLTVVVRKLASLVKATVILLLMLLILPRLVSAAMQTSCASVLSTQQIDQTEITSMVIQIRELGEYECAVYTGEVHMEEMISARFLGIHISDIRVFQTVPGVVTAAADLSQINHSAIQVTDDLLEIRLPQPTITCCELDPDNGIGGVYPRGLPLGSARGIALVQDAMMEEARTRLCQQALQNGLLARAEQELRNQATQIARAAGIDCPVVVTFQGETR